MNDEEDYHVDQEYEEERAEDGKEDTEKIKKMSANALKMLIRINKDYGQKMKNIMRKVYKYYMHLFYYMTAFKFSV